MIKYICVLLISISFVSCFKEPQVVGYLSDNVYLKGADTMFVSIGGKGETNYAWLDGSSQPCNFSIENVRDKDGNRSEQFFKSYNYRSWIKPYDFLTDKTVESVMAKLSDKLMPCFWINPTNGQLQYTETTSSLLKPGDVFNVDAKVVNSAGSKIIKDYTILKLTSTKKAFTTEEIINGISVVRNGGNNFVLYDQINSSQPDFQARRQNVYDDNGKEFVRIHKISDEPKIGIKVIFKLTDAKGVLFNPASYATYAAGTYSYIDVSVNRQNTAEGMVMEFPTTPWPVDVNFRSYLKGPTATDFKSFNIAKLYDDVKTGKAKSLVALGAWPANNWSDASAWFVRIRSIITFYESGTWEISCKIPYTAIDGVFN
jgi:hypothetical protein